MGLLFRCTQKALKEFGLAPNRQYPVNEAAYGALDVWYVNLFRYQRRKCLIFEKGDGDWSNMTLLRASDGQEMDQFGRAVAINDSFAVVGAIGEDGGDGNPRLTSGAVYVYDLSLSWHETISPISTHSVRNGRFGHSVANSGSHVLVGAIFEHGGTDSSVISAGRAYLFDITEPIEMPTAATLQMTSADNQRHPLLFIFIGGAIAALLLISVYKRLVPNEDRRLLDKHSPF